VRNSSLVIVSNLINIKIVARKETLRCHGSGVREPSLSDVGKVTPFPALDQIQNVLITILKGFGIIFFPKLIDRCFIIVSNLIEGSVVGGWIFLLPKRHARRKDEGKGEGEGVLEKLSHGSAWCCV